MGSLGFIEIPLQELTCNNCKDNSNRDDIKQAFLPYSATTVSIDGGHDCPPVTVSLEVERISWRRQNPGKYTAFAIISFPCTDCEHSHKIQHQLEAPSVFIRNVMKCQTCNGMLDLE